MKRSRDSAAVERIQGSDAAASRSILRVPQGDPGESRSAVRGEWDRKRGYAVETVKVDQRGRTNLIACHANFLQTNLIQYSSLAQSVEQRTVNPRVTGSSPVGGARKRADQQVCSLSVFHAEYRDTRINTSSATL